MLNVLLVCAIALALDWFIAKEFYAIAVEKGHSDRKYFWWCFWLGFVDWAMVIALPDRNGGAGIGSKGGFDNLPTI